ncbi:MAG: hypothetical protein K6A80_08380 [Saccharofermentans sp.]|nr:hypothetical protein [Saccharofermentans sp.]
MEIKKYQNIKTIIIAGVILYALFPDIFPGPIDDSLVILIGVIAGFVLGKMIRDERERERMRENWQRREPDFDWEEVNWE